MPQNNLCRWRGTRSARCGVSSRSGTRATAHLAHGGREEPERIRDVCSRILPCVDSNRLTGSSSPPNSLQERSALEWGNQVKLVYSDMRSFNPREKADIIVSELLGSFGDNELSPECLDGVMRTLKREFTSTNLPVIAQPDLTPFSSRRHLDPRLLHLLPRPHLDLPPAQRSDEPSGRLRLHRDRREARRAALRRHVLAIPHAERGRRAVGCGPRARVLDVRSPETRCRG